MANPSSNNRTVAPGVRLIRPLGDFLRAESAGGIVLVAAVVVAMVWANSPWQDSYDELWRTRLSIGLGDHVIDLTLRQWITDGLMSVFFLVVGLEIKRELVEGELRQPRRAALPAIAAVGGMVVPALIYLAIAGGGDGRRGWGIPMATDIAMAVGVMSLLGRRVNASLKLFLLALAIVDDIGAIIVIAVVYTDEVHVDALLVAAALVVVVAALRSVGVTAHVVYVLVGAGLWLALHESGVHATIAGVILGLMAPTRPVVTHDLIDADTLADVSSARAAYQTAILARQSVSTVEWLEHVLHPWTSFAIVPLFALANAGIPIGGDALSDAFSSSITYGVVAGLVVGKFVGVTVASWTAVRLGFAVLPDRVSWAQVMGVAALAGVGFTVSIFVAGLAIDAVALQNQAKIGIVLASVASAIVGAWALARSDPVHRTSTSPPD
jgi:Na+:H+ antiporter, NhaA family